MKGNISPHASWPRRAAQCFPGREGAGAAKTSTGAVRRGAGSTGGEASAAGHQQHTTRGPAGWASPLFITKASHHRLTHGHGHVFYLQISCKDQAWAKTDCSGRMSAFPMRHIGWLFHPAPCCVSPAKDPCVPSSKITPLSPFYRAFKLWSLITGASLTLRELYSELGTAGSTSSPGATFPAGSKPATFTRLSQPRQDVTAHIADFTACKPARERGEKPTSSTGPCWWGELLSSWWGG